MKFGKAMNYTITIEPSANNGFFVTVGCCRLAYTDKKDVVSDLEAFLENPDKYEREYNGSCVNTPQQGQTIGCGTTTAGALRNGPA